MCFLGFYFLWCGLCIIFWILCVSVTHWLNWVIMNFQEIRENFFSDLKDLYFFHYFSSCGLDEQQRQMTYAKEITKRALENEYGTSQEYVNTETLYLTVPKCYYDFSVDIGSEMILSLDEIISNTKSESLYHHKSRNYTIILLADLWENKYRKYLSKYGFSDRSDFFGSVYRIRNSLLHNNRVLDKILYDQSFSYLEIGCEIIFTNQQLGMVVEKAYREICALTALT